MGDCGNLQGHTPVCQPLEVEFSPRIENQDDELQGCLLRLLHQYKREYLGDVLYACLAELVTNATKANMKYVFFHENRMNMHDPGEYELGLAEFKAVSRTTEWLSSYLSKACVYDLRVRILFTHEEQGLRMEVTNSIPLIAEDEKRIREKCKNAAQYENIIDYHRDHADSREGEGLGVALTIILLKSQNVDPGLFRIGNVRGQTVARIEIPFTPEYKTIRKPSV